MNLKGKVHHGFFDMTLIKIEMMAETKNSSTVGNSNEHTELIQSRVIKTTGQYKRCTYQ